MCFLNQYLEKGRVLCMNDEYESRERKAKTISVVVPVFFAAVVVWGLFTGVSAVIEMRQFRDNHLETSAVVLSLRRTSRWDLRGMYSANLGYYVDGVVYHTRVYGHHHFQRGDVVTIYYSPENPNLIIPAVFVERGGGFPVFMAGAWRIVIGLVPIIIAIAAVVSNIRNRIKMSRGLDFGE